MTAGGDITPLDELGGNLMADVRRRSRLANSRDRARREDRVEWPVRHQPPDATAGCPFVGVRIIDPSG